MQVINRYKVAKDHPGTYIGRGTLWGNPFPITETEPRDKVVDKFRRMLARRLAAKDPTAMKAIKDLKGVEYVICSCAPHICHGDCYVEIWDEIDAAGDVNTGVRNWVKKNGYDYGPATDGQTHINMYSKAKTSIGRRLTNMGDVPVTIDGAGTFRCMEGYWYWLSTGGACPALMKTNGYESKTLGKSLERVQVDNFQDKIKYALWKRFEQNPQFKQDFIDTGDLPLLHYYVYGQDDDRTVIFPPYDWITEHLKLLRDLYQGKKVACVLAGSRDMEDVETMDKAIKESRYEFDVVVSGGARGADRAGEAWAKRNGKLIIRFHPDWDHFGKGAGFIRNGEMADLANIAVVTIVNNSTGSADMIKHMKKREKLVHDYHITI